MCFRGIVINSFCLAPCFAAILAVLALSAVLFLLLDPFLIVWYRDVSRELPWAQRMTRQEAREALVTHMREFQELDPGVPSQAFEARYYVRRWSWSPHAKPREFIIVLDREGREVQLIDTSQI